MLDDAILACSIESLENDKDGPLVLGIEPLLQLSEPLGALCEERLSCILVESVLIVLDRKSVV